MTKATTPDFAIPATDEEADAMKKALASFDLKKFEAVRDFLDSKQVKTVVEGLQGLVDLKLSEGSPTQQNIANLVAFLEGTRRGLTNDIAAAEAKINPPKPLPVLDPPAPAPAL